MRQVVIALFAVGFLACSIGSAVLSVAVNRTAETAVSAWVDQVARPDPIGDIIRNRESVEGGNRMWPVLTLILLALIVGAGIILALRFLEPVMKQWNRLRKRARQSTRSRFLQPDYSPYPADEVEEVRPIRRTRELPSLPDGREDGSQWFRG